MNHMEIPLPDDASLEDKITILRYVYKLTIPQISKRLGILKSVVVEYLIKASKINA